MFQFSISPIPSFSWIILCMKQLSRIRFCFENKLTLLLLNSLFCLNWFYLLYILPSVSYIWTDDIASNYRSHLNIDFHRYLKSIHPKADEEVLLDILANTENNVQKASEKLSKMGYEKRDTTQPKVTNRDLEEQVLREQRERENTPPVLPKFKSNEEKAKSMNHNKYQLSNSSIPILKLCLHLQFAINCKPNIQM